MKTTNIIKTAVWMALLAGMSVAGLKYVAVVETGIDERSGATAEITGAEVALVTAELRREAVNNLPSDRYSVMTSETVQSMGGAVLEECAEENCVIVLGSKIGADYIVRGTISKLRALFTLSVEIYETDNGTLLALSDPVRSESIDELVDKAAIACASMYKKFAESQHAKQNSQAAADTAAQQQKKKVKPKKEKPTPKPKPKRKTLEGPPMKLSAGGGAFLASDASGGIQWPYNDLLVAMPYTGFGVFIFFDVIYAEAFAGYSGGGGKWKSNAAGDLGDLPYMSRSYLNIGAFAKYPIGAGRVRFFPLLGVDYMASVSGKLIYYYYYKDKDIEIDKSTSAVWFKLGGGVDIIWDEGVYGRWDEGMFWRVEMTYGWRPANEYEKTLASDYTASIDTRSGNGFSMSVSLGYKF